MNFDRQIAEIEVYRISLEKKGIKVGSDVSFWVKRVSTKNAGFSLSWSGSGIKIYPKIYQGI